MAKEYLVVTIIGPDKRGTVAKITDVIVDYSANIEESRMARLGGDFAVIMLISLNNGDREGLLVGLNELLDGQEAQLFVKETDLARTRIFEGFVPYEISVIGADHEGIVHEVAEQLAEARIQIETMDTHVTPAPVTGTPLFSMQAAIQAPPDLTLHQLRELLSDLSDELFVDIDVKLQ
jgi:glycine cleavage system transcriptional repressor